MGRRLFRYVACGVLDLKAKGKSTVYPSQTVFHNVCLGHTVLFSGLCDLGRKERHKATTRNGVPQGEVVLDYVVIFCV